MKTISGSETKPARTDPLRAYRFTSIIRHVISALYGVMLGFAIDHFSMSAKRIAASRVRIGSFAIDHFSMSAKPA